MPQVGIQRRFECSTLDYPVTNVEAEVSLEMDFVTQDVPDIVARRFAAAYLRRLADGLEAGDGFTVNRQAPAIAAEAPDNNAPDTMPPVKPEKWTIPEGLHLRKVKTAHRALAAIASTQGRKGLSVADICQKARISAVPAYNMINSKTDVGAYLKPLLHVTQNGRTKIVDLTPKGREVASLIRAGTLPA